MRIRSNPAAASRRRIWSSPKPSQTWPICCRYSSRSCGSMSAITSRPRASARARLPPARRPDPAVVQHQQQRGGIELAVGDRAAPRARRAGRRRSRTRAAAVAPPAASRRDRSTATTRATNGASAAATARCRSRVADVPALVEQRGQRLQMRRRRRTDPRGACPTAPRPTSKNSSDLVCRRASTPFSRRAS